MVVLERRAYSGCVVVVDLDLLLKQRGFGVVDCWKRDIYCFNCIRTNKNNEEISF